MSIPQFHIAEFERLLERVIGGRDNFFHCSAATVATIKEIMYTDYPEKEDDIEFLMDMVNYQMRQSGYKGPKPRFPISRHLDQFCSEPLYINSYKKRKHSERKLGVLQGKFVMADDFDDTSDCFKEYM